MSRLPCVVTIQLNEHLRQEEFAEAKWEAFVNHVEFEVDELTEFEYQQCIEYYEEEWDPCGLTMAERIDDFRKFSELLKPRVPCYLSEKKLWEEFCEGDYAVDITYSVSYQWEQLGLFSCLGHDFSNLSNSKIENKESSKRVRTTREPTERERMYA